MSIITQLIKANNIDASWQIPLENALQTMDQHYLQQLLADEPWLPGKTKFLSAFSLPLPKVKTILLGESPYPRIESANGYAFWDAAVGDIWSETGLAKPVNRATSLRNFVKMLLVAEGSLTPNNTTQPAIANCDKTKFIQTNTELFEGLINRGFLLLNATLVLGIEKVQTNAKHWRPFINSILVDILSKQPDITLILFGKIAEMIDKLKKLPNTPRLYAEHPYNVTFINNKKVLDFFRPFDLLYKKV